jgi:hypothetical protein
MTSYPVPPNYADRILVASPSHVVRQRVLESLRSPIRRVEHFRRQKALVEMPALDQQRP